MERDAGVHGNAASHDSHHFSAKSKLARTSTFENFKVHVRSSTGEVVKHVEEMFAKL